MSSTTQSANTTVAGTTRYYSERAAQYAESTVGADPTSEYSQFISRLLPEGRVLDAGCGSGRDTKYFTSQGYNVTAIDASAALARIAERYSGHKCEVLRFQDMTFQEEFDGIWACASLLHVPKSEIHDVLRRFIRALKPGGIFYISLKEGEGERIADDGRFFSDYTQQTFRLLLAEFPALQEVCSWKTPDLRAGPSSWAVDQFPFEEEMTRRW